MTDDKDALKEALHNLIVLARPHFSDATQMLALEQAEAALAALAAQPPADAALVERVARAMVKAQFNEWDELDGGDHGSWCEMAKAALAAASMREQAAALQPAEAPTP